MNDSCRKADGMLALFVGGDLDDTAAAELRRHLHGCVRCRSALDELRATMGWLTRYRMPEIGAAAYEALRQSVLQQIAAEKPRPRLPALLAWAWRLGGGSGAGAQPALALAAAVVVAMGAVGMVATPQSPREPEAAAVATADEAGRSPSPPAGAVVERGELDDSGELEDETGPADQLRIEMKTRDPQVRIIWFTARADLVARNH